MLPTQLNTANRFVPELFQVSPNISDRFMCNTWQGETGDRTSDLPSVAVKLRGLAQGQHILRLFTSAVLMVPYHMKLDH